MGDLTTLSPSAQIEVPAPELFEAIVNEDALAVGQLITCTIPGNDPLAATDPLAWVPVTRVDGIYFPKRGDRGLVTRQAGGAPLLSWWEPTAEAIPAFSFGSVFDHGKVAPVFNIETDFGALASASDNTSPFKEALEAAHAAKGALYVPHGEFTIDQSLIESDTTIFGSGWQSVLKWKAESAHAYLLTNKTHSTGNSNIRICDLAIDGNKEHQAGAAEVLLSITAEAAHRCENIFLERIYAHDSKGLGLAFTSVKNGRIAQPLVGNNDRDGITLYTNCENVSIDEPMIHDCGDDHIGINGGEPGGAERSMTNISVNSPVIFGSGSGPGITVRGGSHIALNDILVDGPTSYGVALCDGLETPLHDVDVSGTIRNVGSGEHAYKCGLLISYSVLHEAGKGFGGIERVNTDNLRIIDPAHEGVKLQNVRGEALSEYGTFRKTTLDGLTVKGATTAVLVGDWCDSVTVRSPNIVDCENGIISTGEHTLRLKVIGDPVIHQINGGYGLRIEKVHDGAIHGVSITNDGKNGQTGIRLKELHGVWSISPDIRVTECTTPYDYGEIGEPETVLGFFNTPPRTKPTGVAKTAEGVWTALHELGLIS